jgi:hypothetical protein
MAAKKISKLFLTIFFGSHFEKGGLLKINRDANFIITNQYLTSKYS